MRFQPTKRPQLQSQKPRSKPSIQKAPQQSSPVNVPDVLLPDSSASTTRPPQAKTTLADWTADGDDNDVNGFYAGEKRQRGGRKKKRKTNKEQAVVIQNWDDIYDPSRPNSYEDYKNSDEKIAEIREWKDRLYAHRIARSQSRSRISDSGTESEDVDRPQMSSEYTPIQKTDLDIQISTDQFLPPSGLNFAAPPTFDGTPSPPPPDDATGEDAYARRIRLSQMNVENTNNSPPPQLPLEDAAIGRARASAAPVPTISRAPIRYNLPPPPSELPSSEAELASALKNEPTEAAEEKQEGDEEENTPRSLRPGQKGFAERLMSKYGWSKGSGLGASGSGIVNPLRVQVEKQKKKPDSEGGGIVGPQTGTIIGGKKRAGGGEEGGKFGNMSEVVILRGMVDGMDLDAEMGDSDGGLIQEIGEECGQKYGRVERVFINRSNPAKASVFVKFTSQLSALRVCSLSLRNQLRL